MLVNKLNNCKKILGVFTCFLAGSFSDSSLAFTLGDIRLESSLNEPLVANIQLLELDGLDESQILVALGSEADFDRVGVEPLPLLNELEFDVEVLSRSEGLVRISSADAIVEPYLNFVLNVRWPSGRVIREYTVLLDLPTFTANPTPAPSPTPARTTPTTPVEPAPPVRRSDPEPVQPQVTDATEDEMPPARGMDNEPDTETVVIQSGDSLWNIALATRPGNDVSVQQMMLAIQRANTNSDAFIGNNINGIRAGRVLRIPSREEINAINQEQAIAQVAVQNQQFSNNAQPLAVNNSQESGRNTRDELSIVNSVDNDAESAEIADLNATIANLENELALSEENLDRALLENEELNSRLNDLEEEIAILENIIAIEGQRMAELQAEMANQTETADSEVLAVVTDTAATPEPEAVPEPPMPAPSAPPSTGILSQVSNLLSSTLGMVAALVVLLALVVGFLIARNRKTVVEDDFDTMLAEEEENEQGSADSGEFNEREDFAAADLEDDETEENSVPDEEDVEFESEFESADDNMESLDSDIENSGLVDNDGEDEEGFTEDLDVEEEDDSEPQKAGFLAGLLARFSRKKNETTDDEEDYFDESIDDDEEYSEDEAESEDEMTADEKGAVAREEDISDEELEDFLGDIDIDTEEEDSDENNLEEDEESEDEIASEESVTKNEFDIELGDNESEEELSENIDYASEAVANSDEVTEEATEAESDSKTDEVFEFNLDDEPETLDEFDETIEEAAEPESEDEVFEFNLHDESESADKTEQQTAKSEEPEEELESFQFTVSDDKPETSDTEETVHKQDEDELETFDLGDFTFDDNDEAEDSEKTDNAAAPEDADDTDEIVLDLDDEDSDALDEIEFLDEDEKDDDEGSVQEIEEKTGASSLGNLGLDDAIALDESDEEELEIITDQDEVSTKLDLAVAYQAMDDLAGAKEILNEVIAEGNEAQVAEAKKLLSEWGDS